MVVDIRTWVKNVVNQPPNVTSNDIIVPLSPPTMCAKAVLICRPNSHPFQDRTLLLDQPVKVGRSVARARASPTNAIFDCKVLSRHHALLSYKDGKFYLQDTKSSNGTFVNNNRLSPGGTESIPHEVCSGDIVQFGVDVVENNRKVTHGCIIATLKLYLHDGKEAKASHSLTTGSNISSIPLDELYKLNQYLQDALQREQLLESKLSTLHSLVEQARETTNLSWQAFIGEDRLLSRVEILESQLLAYSKNYTEDKIREELLRLQEEKNDYQNTAKENLRNLHEERLDALSKVTELQQQITTAEEEVAVYKDQYTRAQEELQELAQRFSTKEQSEAELTSQLAQSKEKEQEQDSKIQELLDRIDTESATIEEMFKQIEKLQQDKYILTALITELDKCTLNNCPVEIKFKVDNIIKEFNKNSSEKVADDGIDNSFTDKENHKDNNVSLMNMKTDKYQELSSAPEELLRKLQEEIKVEGPENDNKIDEIDMKEKMQLQEQLTITNWPSHYEGKTLEVDKSEDNLKEETENCLIIEKDNSIIGTLKIELSEARNEIIEKQVIISKMSDEIENLLESSAMVNAKINLLENDLLEERQTNLKYKNDLENIKEQLSSSQNSLEKFKNEENSLLAQINNLQTELNYRPTVESFMELKITCDSLQRVINDLKEEMKLKEEKAKRKELMKSLSDDDEMRNRFSELEEELVVVKENYAKSVEDKILLNKSMDKLQREYMELTNRSHNVMFFYIAPLIFLVAYLMFTTLIS